MSLQTRLSALITAITNELNAAKKPASEVSANTTLDWDDSIINVLTAGGSVTITLPSASTYSGKAYIINREGANTVVMSGVTATLTSDGAAIGVISNGTTWKIISSEGTIT